MGKTRKTLTFILPILAMVFGFLGFLYDGTDLYHSFLSSFKYVGTGAPFEPFNVFTEIARWCGIFFAASLFFALLDAVLTRLTNKVGVARALSQADSVAFHGDNAMIETIAAKCGKRAVLTDDPRAFRCKTQVLLFSDDAKALDFYAKHAKELEQAERVVINLDTMHAGTLDASNLYPISLAEVSAQRYWTEHPAQEGETIFLIGEGSYAEALITWALLTNVLSAQSNISYYAAGNFSEYRALHGRITEAFGLGGDRLVFLEGSWHDHLDLIRKAGLSDEGGRIIVCLPGEESVSIASSIIDAGLGGRVHFRAADASCINFFSGAKGPQNMTDIVVFGTDDELCTPEYVLEERQYRGGKLADLAYSCQGETCNGCPCHPEFTALDDSTDPDVRTAEAAHRLKTIDVDECLGCERFIAHWRGWSGFVRQSNYAVAAHDFHKVRMLRGHGIDVAGMTQQECVDAFAALPKYVRDKLQEIEHIRWMRFHYLYNWHYGEVRNNRLRLHYDLLPYDELPEKEQVKDADAYKFLSIRVKPEKD